MAQTLSKIFNYTCSEASCIEYVHPWSDNCLQATAGLYLCALVDSLRIYGTVYLLTLLTKGKIPTKEDIKKTLYGVLQSTAFLSATAFCYSSFLCLFRKLFGSFNFLTVSALPSFASCVFSIIIERPSRRTLLALYVSNVATETVWNMLLSRQLVKSMRYGEVGIFGISMAFLLYYYKKGSHRKQDNKHEDSMFRVLKFVVGPYEEKDFGVRSSQANIFYQQNISNNPLPCTVPRRSSRSQKGNVYSLISKIIRKYKQIIEKIKCCDRHYACAHPFSCLYYSLEGAGKMFSLGLGIQLTLKLILNMKKIFASPRALQDIVFKRDTLNLATFLGGFAGLFRASLCLLRRLTNKDRPIYAFPAALIASVAFVKYPDRTVALYIMWKALQISYNIGVDRGYLPRVPGFPEFLYCFSTAILFHVALIEPTNLRPSYWKFLHSISGGRIACMNRDVLDVWGLKSSQLLDDVLKKTKTTATLSFLL